MKAQLLTSISTALVAMTGSVALAQSITVPRQSNGNSPRNTSSPAASPSAPSSPNGSTKPGISSPKAEIGSDELQKFAKAVKKLRPIERSAQTQIKQTLQQENLSEQRFNEIAQARQNPQSQPSTSITPTEAKKFHQVSAKIAQIQQVTYTKMERAVRDEGLDVQRFNQILTVVGQNPALRQQVQQMLHS